MKVTITTGYESLDEEETFDLKVEGELSDKPKKVAEIYLELRKKLREGIRKDTGTEKKEEE